MERKENKRWKGKTRGGLLGYRFFIFLIKVSGTRAAYLFLGLVVIYFIPFAPKATRANWRYARNILRYNLFRSACFLFLSYYRFGQTLVDKIAIGSGQTDQYDFHFDDTLSHFMTVLNGGQGVVFISAHVGNWEIGVPFFGEYGKKMHIVLFDAEYQKIKELLSKQMQTSGYKIIPVNEDDLSHVFKIKKALNDQEYVCFQGDRFVEGSKTRRVEFMGKPADFPVGPFMIASRLQLPVVFYFALRQKGMRYFFRFVQAMPAGEEEQSKPETALLKQYVQTLESVVREYPEQWFNYYDFWK